MKKSNLNNHSNKTPFNTPEGYFEDLPMRVQHRIQQRTNQGWQFQMIRIGKYAIAPMMLLIIVWWSYMPTKNKDTVLYQANTLEKHEQLVQEVGYENVIDYLSEGDALLEEDLYTLADGLGIDAEREDLEDSFLEEVDLHELEDYM